MKYRRGNVVKLNTGQEVVIVTIGYQPIPKHTVFTRDGQRLEVLVNEIEKIILSDDLEFFEKSLAQEIYHENSK